MILNACRKLLLLARPGHDLKSNYIELIDLQIIMQFQIRSFEKPATLRLKKGLILVYRPLGITLMNGRF